MADPLSARFTELEITPRSIRVLATTAEFTVPLEFNFDREVPVTSSSVALALATLCGQKFDNVLMDFDVNQDVALAVSSFTGAEVKVHDSGPARPHSLRNGNVLSFSGGFDSLAALALMPADTHLVSLDFGGWFEREAKFFRRFNPLVVQTNLRSAPHPRQSLALNHWSFMAVGALLTADYFGGAYHTFGNILGEKFASPNGEAAASLSLLECAGYVPAPYTAGLTEVATARLAMHAFPHLIEDSITSLAGTNDRKRLLKIAMAHLIREIDGLEINLPPIPDRWESPVRFSSSYTTALGYLYFVGKDYSHLLNPLFREVPDWIRDLAGHDGFAFHEHFDTDHYRSFPDSLWPGLQAGFARFGVRPYGQREYLQAARARSLLNPAFGFPIP